MPQFTVVLFPAIVTPSGCTGDSHSYGYCQSDSVIFINVLPLFAILLCPQVIVMFAISLSLLSGTSHKNDNVLLPWLLVANCCGFVQAGGVCFSLLCVSSMYNRICSSKAIFSVKIARVDVAFDVQEIGTSQALLLLMASRASQSRIIIIKSGDPLGLSFIRSISNILYLLAQQSHIKVTHMDILMWARTRSDIKQISLCR